MADERENIIEEREKKLNDERQKIETFSDFGNIYNFKNDFTYSYKTDAGLTPEIVREISEKKHEPQWMLDFRLKSLNGMRPSPSPSHSYIYDNRFRFVRRKKAAAIRSQLQNTGYRPGFCR